MKLFGRCATITFLFLGGGRSSPDEKASDPSVCGRDKFGDDRFFFDESPLPIIEIGSRLKSS